jgi:hypothetical protein
MKRIVILLLLVATGCSPYRVEYHNRPKYYEQVSDRELPSEVVLADGTRIKYTEGGRSQIQSKVDDDSEPFEIRSVADNGRVTLRNLVPEHVVTNMMTCIRNEEYEIVYDQLLSDRTKVVYENEGGSKEKFTEFCQKNRRDIMITLNRMSFGFSGQDVYLKPLGGGVTRAGFSPRIAETFKFKHVEFVSEMGGAKLLRIY